VYHPIDLKMTLELVVFVVHSLELSLDFGTSLSPFRHCGVGCCSAFVLSESIAMKVATLVDFGGGGGWMNGCVM